MSSSTAASTFQLNTPKQTSTGNKRFKILRSLPKSWLIAAILFYCASLITVGLLAGLLPRRTKQITVLVAPTPLIPIDTSTATPDPSSCIEDECNPRLSSDLIVHNYELEYFYNNTRQTTVQGQVTIEFTLKQPIKQLIYHSKRMLRLEDPSLFEDGVYRLVSMRKYVPHDYISLRLATNASFATNRYRLVQRFFISLTEGTAGFYQSLFNDGNETMGKLLSTQFEPTDARKAFPCFDEPHLKAQFTISIVHPDNTIALANFPTTEETMDNSLRRTKFMPTFRMSTYLAAWAIVPNTYGKKADDPDEPMLTIWARREPTERNHTALALDVALKTVAYFVGYFNTAAAVPPKIDLLGVPEFSAGAMENWGLITFREQYLLFDEKVASTVDKQSVGEVVAHELAHFWFGNYVTCKWWVDLWLNEAMATWLSYKPLTESYPDWNRELQVLTEQVISSMWDDAKPSSHPIVVKNVSDAGEIISLFDSITYSKGASILRMLEKIVGPDRFRDGLRDYLRINAFDVGDPSIFYNGLFTDINGEEFMKNWLEEMNYPLLNVNLQVQNGETKVTFTQSRFIISDALDSSRLNQTYRWKIKMQCVLGGNYPDSDTTSIGGDTIDFLLETEQETKILPGKSYSWIKCNRHFQGYHVTQYLFPSNTWQRFSNVLVAQPAFFSDEDKVNLLQDTFFLGYKGLIDYIEPLRIVQALVKSNTQQFVLWKTFQWHWEMLADLINYLPDTLTKFQVRRMLGASMGLVTLLHRPSPNRLKLSGLNFATQHILSNGVTLSDISTLNPNDDHNTKLVKGLKFEFLCRMKHPEAIAKASELFKTIPVEYFNNNNVDISVGADFLSSVYMYHIKNTDNENDWNMLYNYYKIAISPQEQTRALAAISSTNNRDRLNRLLNEGLTGGSNGIKRHDYFTMMRYMIRHSIGRETVWTFYKTNYQRLLDTFTLEDSHFGTSILSIAQSFEKSSYLEEMNQLFEKYPNAGTGISARKQALDQVNMNIEWIKSREQNLRNAFDSIPPL